MPLFGPPNTEKMRAKRNINGLIKALTYNKDGTDEEDRSIRRHAAICLGEIKDRRAVEPLIAALKDKDELTRVSAAWAIGNIGDTRAVGALIMTLRDSNKEIRETSAKALAVLGWQPADAKERVLRAIALSKWQDVIKEGVDAVEPLIATLKDSDEKVREASAKALGEFKDARIVEPLIVALKSSSSDMQATIRNVLFGMGQQSIEHLVVALRDQDRDVWINTAWVLAAIHDSQAVEALEATINPLIVELETGIREQILKEEAVERIAFNLRDHPADGQLSRMMEIDQKIAERARIRVEVVRETLEAIGEPVIKPLMGRLEFWEEQLGPAERILGEQERALEGVDIMGYVSFSKEADIVRTIISHMKTALNSLKQRDE